MPHTTTSRRAPAWAVPTAVGVAVIVLISAIVWSNGLGSDSGAAPTSSPSSAADSPATSAPDGETSEAPPTEVDEPAELTIEDVERRDPDDLLAIGPVDAAVVLVVFSDYQCQFCAKWTTNTLPVMMEYVEDGDLRIEWRDVNVYGRDSERAARAAYAAALQGQFWEYHHELYPNGGNRSPGDLSEDSLVELAAQLSLDVPQFRDDMNADATVAEVARNEELGISLGAFSTPSFMMGGQPLVGAQPTEVFVEAFEQVYADVTR